MTKVIGKIEKNTIEVELQVNKLIDEKIEPYFELEPKYTKKSVFNFRSVDPNNISYLDISDKDHSYIHPAFKFIKFHNLLSAVNVTNTGFTNNHMELLSEYLKTNPGLFSITLDDNPFTDTGLNSLAEALQLNTKVCHLAFRRCKGLSRTALGMLSTALHDINMVLYQIDFDKDVFEEQEVE